MVKDVTRIQMKFLIYALLLILALLIDAIWLAFYTTEFWSSAYIDSNTLWALRRTDVVVSYLLVAAEVGACFLAVALGASEPLITRRF
jgi:hypothetical protein